MSPKLDKQTNKITSDQQKVRELVNSDGWAIVRRILMDKLMDVGSILNFDDNIDAQKAVTEIAAKKIAVQMIYEWIKHDIEGIAQQYENSQDIHKEMKESYILRMEELSDQ